MKYTEITQLGVSELIKKKESLVADLFQAKMKNSTGQLGNPVQIRFLRKDLARVETALTLKAAAGEVMAPTKEAKPAKKAAAKKTAAPKAAKKTAKGTK